MSQPPGTGSLRSALLRAGLLAAIIVAAVIALRWGPGAELFDRESIIATLDRLRHSGWAAPALVAALALISPTGLPVTPLLVAGAVVFGIWWGWLLNLLGCLLGGVLGFMLAQKLGRDLVAHTIGGKALERVQGLIERHGFWTLLRIRFVPIPYGLVNYAAALAGVPFRTFFLATLIALIPVLFVSTFVSHAIVYGAASGRANLLWSAGGVLLAIFLLTWLPGVRRLRGQWSRDQ